VFGLSPWLLAGIVAAIAIIAGEGIALNGAWDSKAAAERDLKTMTGLRDGLAHDLDNAIEARDREHREADAADATAKATLAAQKLEASKIRGALDTATETTETLIQQIQDARHARPAIVVSQTVTDGFDPLIVVGLERLKCVQRARNRSQPADGCGVPLSLAGGGAGAAGATNGAGDYRPGFDTQLRMLNDMWRLHDWGASCYQDKAAIRAAQP
jgi:hypothetical protein